MVWLTVTAENYCDSVRDGTHDSPKQVSEGKKLLTSKHIKGGRIDSASANFISIQDFEKINERSRVDKNDILFSMIGTVGEIARVDQKPDYAIKNMGLFKIADELRSKYLYYYLKSPAAREYIISSMAGSTQQYLSLTALRAFPILVPDDKSMTSIVSILDAIDDEIRNNSLINDYLAA